MEWIIQHVLHVDSLFAAGLTLVMSLFGAKKVFGKKVKIVLSVIKETLDVVLVLSNALKPDDDGKVRIEKKELEEIKRELSEMQKSLGKVVALR